MALQGHVKTISLIEIFQFLSANRHTGTLVVSGRAHERTLYFFEGAIHFPRSGELTVGRLGDFLVRQGKISVDQLYRALEEQKRTAKLIGEILVEQGDLTPEGLEQALRTQYEEETYQIFIWDDATFTFRKGEIPAEACQPESSIILKADSILMEAARRADEWARLTGVIPSLHTILVPREGAVPEIAALTAKRKVNLDAQLINGERSVAAIFSEAREGIFQVAEILTALLAAELVRPLPAANVPDAFRAALKSGNFNLAVALILHGYDARDSSRDVIRELEGTLYKTRTFLRASERLTIILRREGAALVEFVLNVLRNLMTGVLICRWSNHEAHFHFDKQLLRLWVSGRDLLQLEHFLDADRRLSPIDVKKLMMQIGKAESGVNAALASSGIVDMRAWHQHLLKIWINELYATSMAPGLEAVFEKNATLAGFPAGGVMLELETNAENTFFELTESLARWIERAEHLPNLDMVLTETGFGQAVDSPVISYVNSKSSAREIMERSRLGPVATYEALIQLIETEHARPLNENEMMNAVQHMLEHERFADALRLCRAAQRSDLAVETFAEVEKVIVEEHGDLAAGEREYILSGEPGDFSLAEVLQSLHTHGKSGTLKISDGANAREIHFDKGHVTYLRTVDAEKSSFGSQFLGEFDLQDMTEALFGGDEIPTGEVDESQVPEALCEQIKEEIYDTFIWDNASFVFTANHFPAEYNSPSASTTKLRLETDRFMMRAVSIIQDWESIQRAFSMKTIFKFVSSEAKMEAVKELGTPEVLYLIDGRLPVKSIVRRSGFDKLRVCKLLFDLLEAEWIQPLTVEELLGAASHAIEKNDVPGALTYLTYALELEPDNADVKEVIEQISAQGGEI